MNNVLKDLGDGYWESIPVDKLKVGERIFFPLFKEGADGQMELEKVVDMLLTEDSIAELQKASKEIKNKL